MREHTGMSAVVNRTTGWALVGLVLAAFAVRVSVAAVVQQRLDADPLRAFVVEGDANGYWELAQRLATGRPYAVHDPPRRVMRMPGFPLLLSVSIRLFGPDHWAARVVNCAVGSAACALVFALARATAGRKTAWPAAIGVAFAPTLVGMSALLLSETLFAVAVLVSLLSLVPLTRSVVGRGAFASEDAELPPEGAAADAPPCPAGTGRDSRRGWLSVAVGGLAAGAAGALATYVRPSWLLFPPLYSVWLIIRTRCAMRSFVAAACIVVGLFGTLLPWALRNRRPDVAGHWVWTTLWAGPSLYDGLNPDATGASDMAFIDREGVYRRLSEYDADRHYRTRAWEFARRHPVRVVALAFAKWKRFFSPWPLTDAFDNPLVRWAMGVYWGAAVVGGAAGMWRLRKRPEVLALLAGPMAYFAAVHGIFVGSMRYRVPGEPPWLVLAGRGWWVVASQRIRWKPSDGNA
ncbi:MAG: hypothetical protein D6725_12755 [Planctomycetota bacterium]|nr:MAG: hypothetical protein D6725_12755 [Planctomycetota bacterium]